MSFPRTLPKQNLRSETWTVISVGGRIDFGVPAVYPTGTSMPMVLAQPFAKRIRRGVAAHGDGGWVVRIFHTCETVLCTCTPHLDIQRTSQ